MSVLQLYRKGPFALAEDFVQRGPAARSHAKLDQESVEDEHLKRSVSIRMGTSPAKMFSPGGTKAPGAKSAMTSSSRSSPQASAMSPISPSVNTVMLSPAAKKPVATPLAGNQDEHDDDDSSLHSGTDAT